MSGLEGVSFKLNWTFARWMKVVYLCAISYINPKLLFLCNAGGIHALHGSLIDCTKQQLKLWIVHISNANCLHTWLLCVYNCVDKGKNWIKVKSVCKANIKTSEFINSDNNEAEEDENKAVYYKKSIIRTLRATKRTNYMPIHCDIYF